MKSSIKIGLVLVFIILLVYGILDPNKFPFPPCPFLKITGWKCPGCGSQRALHQFLHGELSFAFKLNALFLPALAYVVYGYVTRAFFQNQWNKVKDKMYGRRAAGLILGIILLFWIARNL